MLRVLWIALILNSILITKQVTYNNLKAKKLSFSTAKIHSQSSLNHKLRSIRKTLRKDRRNLPKVGVDDWGYEDISEPLQYNYKEVWWTKNYPDFDDRTQRTTKTNVLHENITEVTNNATSIFVNHSTTIRPIGRVKNNPKRHKNRTNPTTKKFFTNITQYSVKLTETTKAQIRSNKNTIQIVQPTTFIDKDKGYLFPVFSRNDDGPFSIMANQTGLNLKKNENDSDVRGSITSNIFISDDFNLDDFDFIVIRPNDTDSKKAQRQDNNEPIIIDIVRTDNIGEKIKKSATGENILIAPQQSDVLANVAKDGIYRIEIPEPVTKKTNNNPQIDVDQPALQSNHPPWPAVEAPHDYPNNNIGNNKYSPFPNIKSPRNGPGLQHSRHERLKSFYETTSLGQNRQSPLYYTQNPGHNRQGSYNKPNTFGQNGPSPVYNPQNPGYDRQRPRYTAQNSQSPFYDTNRQGPYPAQNLSNDIQGPPFITNSSEHHRRPPFYTTKGLGDGRQGHPPTIEDEYVAPEIVLEGMNDTELIPAYQNIVFGVESPTNPNFEVTERSTITFEPGYGPIKENAPVHFDGPTIGPISSYVQELLEDMTQLNMGFFSMFLIKLFSILARKKPEDLRHLLSQAQFEVTIMFEREHLLLYFGEPFGSTMMSFATNLGALPIDVAQSAASMLHYTMVNRRDGLTMDINSLIDYIDSLYEDTEGVALLRVVEEIENYPDGGLDSPQIHRHLSKALYEPVRRLSGTTKRQILFDSINRVIENHSRGLIADRNEGRRDNKHSNIKLSFTNPMAIKKVTNDKNKRYQVTKDIWKGIPPKTPTQRLLIDKHKSKAFTKYLKQLFEDISVIKNTNNNAQKKYEQKKSHKLKRVDSTTRKHIFEINFPNKMTKNNDYTDVNDFKKKGATKLKSEIDKITYLNRPISEGTIKNAKITNKYTKATPKNLIINPKGNNRSDKIGKLKEIIAEQIFKAQADNYRIAKTVRTNILRSNTNDTADEQNEETTTSVGILEKETSNVESSKESSESREQHKNKKDKKRKHQKPSHLHKKEIRHLRHRHPKMYKKYLRHIKKIKRDKKHKKKSHKQHKKKSHHTKKKKKNKVLKTFKDVEHHYERLLKHYMLRKTHLNKARMSESEIDMSKEYKDIFSIENHTDAYAYLYDSFNSIEKDTTKDIKRNAMTTPNFAFITPFTTAKIVTSEKTTENWVQYPILKKEQTTIQNLKISNKIKDLANDRSLNSESFEDLEDSMNIMSKFNVKKSLSYSDEENELKINLYDAMRHEKLYFKPERRSFDVKEKKDKLRTFSSYSSEEVVLKSNIYKAVGFNKYYRRVNFSDIVKKDSGEKVKKLNFRRKFKPINELSSYSDEEDILKQKLKL